MRGLSSSQFYLCDLLNSNEIVAVQEHWLNDSNVNHLNNLCDTHVVYSKCSESNRCELTSRRGSGGIAIFIHKSLEPRVKLIPTESDRIISISLKNVTQASETILLNVYMPTGNGADSRHLYQSVLDEITHHISRLPPTATVNMVGDLNADITVPKRQWKRQAKDLDSFMLHNKLTSLNNLYLAQDQYTFCSDNGLYKSHLDYILANKEATDLFTSFKIGPEMPKNVSDHLPVQAQISCLRALIDQPTTNKSQRQYGMKFSKFNVKWTDLSKEDIANLYTSPLEDACKELWRELPPDPRHLTAEQAELLLEDLTIKIMTISADTLPHSRSVAHKQRRPEWSKEVDRTYLHMKQLWKTWKDKGRPRARNNSTWTSYKKAKRLFRRTLRRSRLAKHNNLVEEIEASRNDDQCLFSRLVKENMSASKANLTECIVWEETTYTDQEVLEGWEKYFRSLSSSQTVGSEEITAERDNMGLNHVSEDPKITFNSRDLHTAIQGLKPKKAGGLDQVVAEHLLNSGPVFQLLLTVMNSFCRHAHVPQNFKRGIVIPIHKGKGKPLTDPGNYRGITLTSVFCKVFELLLKPVLEKSLLQQDIPDSLQAGFQKDHSCIMTALSLNLIIEMNSAKRLDTHIALLDATKAFDTVWHDGLFHKLQKAGIPGNLWMILRNLYRGLESMVMWRGRLSQPFSVNQGVRQGGVLSPCLYLVYIDSLIKALRSADAGCHLRREFTGVLVLADDVALISTSPEDLQAMLNTTHKYTTKWRYKINPSKSAIISTTDASTSWQFGPNIIKQVETHPHLGITRTFSRHNPTTTMASRGRKTLYALTGVGAHKCGLAPRSVAALWNRFCLPRMLYGAEVLYLSKKMLTELDRTQCHLFKSLLGLPRSTANEAISIFTNLPPVPDEVDKLFLRLLGKVLLLPHERIERRLLLHVICQIPTSRTIKNLNEKLSLYQLPTLEELISSPPPHHTWKTMVRNAVEEHRTDLTEEAVIAKSSLHLLSTDLDLNHVHKLLPSVIHPPRLRQAVPIKVQLLSGVYPTNSRKYITSNTTISPCCPCGCTNETVIHLVGECPLYSTIRDGFLAQWPRQWKGHYSTTKTQAECFTKLTLLGSCPHIFLSDWHNPSLFHNSSLSFVLDLHVKRTNVTMSP